MSSQIKQIFNISVVGGALGLAFSDSLSESDNSWIGLGIGLIVTFVFLSALATISELGTYRVKPQVAEPEDNSSESQVIWQEQSSTMKQRANRRTQAHHNSIRTDD